MGFEIGDSLAGYRIERQLGRGSSGTVYLARHPRLSRSDTLKVLSQGNSADPDYRRRFLQEAEVASRVSHPNVVAVYDRGEADGSLWIALQYVPGTDAASLIGQGPDVLTAERAVHIITEAAHGLDEIHRAGLLHRDIKPGNLLVDSAVGRPDRVLVTDFGIARVMGDETTLVSGQRSTISSGYPAPEVLRGELADRHADVYGLGCTLYEMLTGTTPFPGDELGPVLQAHLNDPPPRPSAARPGVPAAFDAVIAHALAKDPADRFSSCGELAAAAERALSSPAPVVRSRRRRWVIGAAAVLVVAVAVAIGLVAVHATRSSNSASPRVPVADSIDPKQWGVYAYIAEAFPALLPPAPAFSGYQGLGKCFPSGTPEQANTHKYTFDMVLPVEFVVCLGDYDPADMVSVSCRSDRAPTSAPQPHSIGGSAAWRRLSGTGTLQWRDMAPDPALSSNQNLPWAVLDIYFDDPRRNFCWISVFGRGTAQDLRTRWWDGAPL